MLVLMLNASTVESFYKALIAAKFPFKMTKIKLLLDHFLELFWVNIPAYYMRFAPIFEWV